MTRALTCGCLLIVLVGGFYWLYETRTPHLPKNELIFLGQSPQLGDPCPDIVVMDDQGNDFALAELRGHYSVVILGCLTCPPFLQKVRRIDAVARDYQPRGVKFYYLYKALSHPLAHGYASPYTPEERLAQVAEARRICGDVVPWLCDTMDNAARRAFGGDNSEFIIDPSGRIVQKRLWCDPDALRQDLIRLVGPVDPITPPEPDSPAPRFLASKAPTGIVPPVPLRGRYVPLRIEPVIVAGGEPFYVKLRAEAQPALLQEGEGSLYVGLHLDPMYRVHWNNLADPVQVELSAPRPAILPRKLTGPEVSAETDADPREFVVNVKFDGWPGPLDLTVRYFACHDEAGWCKAVTQHYRVHFEYDEAQGEVFRCGQTEPRLLVLLDQDGDGVLTRGELEDAAAAFDEFDVTRDGVLDRMELLGQP